jgi:NAD(P)-dependent dehydrogenase (short-subunit alcohol dehydrogenase family)
MPLNRTYVGMYPSGGLILTSAYHEDTRGTDMPSILITGVSSGIGKAATARFAGVGWRVTGTVRDPESEKAGAFPAGVRLMALDLSEPASIDRLAAAVLADLGGAPDVLLNNAGMLLFKSVEDTTQEEFRRVFQVNVFGQVQLITAFLPAMRERGSGLIANVTSLGGRLTFPFFGAYNSSKHALEGISEGLWHELRPFGIRVKAIEPGYVDTPIYKKAGVSVAGVDQGSPAYRRWMSAMLLFEKRISRRTSPEAAAEEVWKAVNDPSDRLRYPIAAYARPLVAARRLVGDLAVMKVMHGRWMGGK